MSYLPYNSKGMIVNLGTVYEVSLSHTVSIPYTQESVDTTVLVYALVFLNILVSQETHLRKRERERERERERGREGGSWLRERERERESWLLYFNCFPAGG